MRRQKEGENVEFKVYFENGSRKGESAQGTQFHNGGVHRD